MKDSINSKNVIVAFLDILGYSDLVHQNEASNLIFGAIDLALDRWQENAGKHQHNIGGLVKDNISLDVLSDSFVVVLDQEPILQEYGDTSETRCIVLMIFLGLISFLIQDCIREIHYLFRGAIVCGKYYKKEFNNLKGSNFIFSEALCKAHQIERDISSVPRVIVDSSVLSSLKDKDIELLSKNNKPGRELMQDNDGLYYLNIYSSMVNHNSLAAILRAIVSIMQPKLRGDLNAKVLRKYVWFANYHNSFVAHVIESNAKESIPCFCEIKEKEDKMFIAIPKFK
jgi:hypothetical protein